MMTETTLQIPPREVIESVAEMANELHASQEFRPFIHAHPRPEEMISARTRQMIPDRLRQRLETSIQRLRDETPGLLTEQPTSSEDTRLSSLALAHSTLVDVLKQAHSYHNSQGNQSQCETLGYYLRWAEPNAGALKDFERQPGRRSVK